jgi:hypothetical protein
MGRSDQTSCVARRPASSVSRSVLGFGPWRHVPLSGAKVQCSDASDFLAPMVTSKRSVVARSAAIPFSSCPIDLNPIADRGSFNISRSLRFWRHSDIARRPSENMLQVIHYPPMDRRSLYHGSPLSGRQFGLPDHRHRHDHGAYEFCAPGFKSLAPTPVGSWPVLSWRSGQYCTDSIGQPTQARARSRRHHKRSRRHHKTSEPHFCRPGRRSALQSERIQRACPPIGPHGRTGIMPCMRRGDFDQADRTYEHTRRRTPHVRMPSMPRATSIHRRSGERNYSCDATLGRVDGFAERALPNMAEAAPITPP